MKMATGNSPEKYSGDHREDFDPDDIKIDPDIVETPETDEVPAFLEGRNINKEVKVGDSQIVSVANKPAEADPEVEERIKVGEGEKIGEKDQGMSDGPDLVNMALEQQEKDREEIKKVREQISNQGQGDEEKEAAEAADRAKAAMQEEAVRSAQKGALMGTVTQTQKNLTDQEPAQQSLNLEGIFQQLELHGDVTELSSEQLEPIREPLEKVMSLVQRVDEDFALEKKFEAELDRLEEALGPIHKQLQNSRLLAERNRARQAVDALLRKNTTPGEKIDSDLERKVEESIANLEELFTISDEERRDLIASLRNGGLLVGADLYLIEELEKAETDEQKDVAKEKLEFRALEIISKNIAPDLAAVESIDINELTEDDVTRLITDPSTDPELKLRLSMSLLRLRNIDYHLQDHLLKESLTLELKRIIELSKMQDRLERRDLLLNTGSNFIDLLRDGGTLDLEESNRILEELSSKDDDLSIEEKNMAEALRSIVSAQDPNEEMLVRLKGVVQDTADLELVILEKDQELERSNQLMAIESGYRSALWAAANKPEQNIPEAIAKEEALRDKLEQQQENGDDSEVTELARKAAVTRRNRLAAIRNKLNASGELDQQSVRDLMDQRDNLLQDMEQKDQKIEDLDFVVTAYSDFINMQKDLPAQLLMIKTFESNNEMPKERINELYDQFRFDAAEEMAHLTNQLREYQQLPDHNPQVVEDMGSGLDRLFNILSSIEEQNPAYVRQQLNQAAENQPDEIIEIRRRARGLLNRHVDNTQPVQNEQRTDVDQEDETQPTDQNESRQGDEAEVRIEREDLLTGAQVAMLMHKAFETLNEADTGSPNADILIEASTRLQSELPEGFVSDEDLKSSIEILNVSARLTREAEQIEERAERENIPEIEETERVLNQTDAAIEDRIRLLEDRGDERYQEILEGLREIREQITNIDNNVQEQTFREMLAEHFDEEDDAELINTLVGVLVANRRADVRAGADNLNINIIRNGAGSVPAQNVNLPTVNVPQGGGQYVITTATPAVLMAPGVGAGQVTQETTDRITQLEQGQARILELLQNGANAEAIERLQNATTEQLTGHTELLEQIIQEIRDGNLSNEEAAQRLEAIFSEEAIEGYIERGVNAQNDALERAMAQMTTQMNQQYQLLREQMLRMDSQRREDNARFEALIAAIANRDREPDEEFQLPETREATEALIAEIERQIAELEQSVRNFENLEFAVNVPELYQNALQTIKESGNLPEDATREQILEAINNYLENNDLNALIEAEEGELSQLNAWLNYRAIEDLRDRLQGDEISDENGANLNALSNYLNSPQGYRNAEQLRNLLGAEEGNELQAGLATRFSEILEHVSTAENNVRERGEQPNATNVADELRVMIAGRRVEHQQNVQRLELLRDRLQRLNDHLETFDGEPEPDPDLEVNALSMENEMGQLAQDLMVPDVEDESGVIKRALRWTSELAIGVGGGMLGKAAVSAAIGAGIGIAGVTVAPALIVPLAIGTGIAGGAGGRLLSGYVKGFLNRNKKYKPWLAVAKPPGRLSPFKKKSRNHIIESYNLRGNINNIASVYNKLQQVDLESANAYSEANLIENNISKEELGSVISSLEQLRELSRYGGLDYVEGTNMPQGVNSTTMINRVIMQIDAINRANGGNYLTEYQNRSKEIIDRAYKSGKWSEIRRGMKAGGLVGGLAGGLLQMYEHISHGTNFWTGEEVTSASGSAAGDAASGAGDAASGSGDGTTNLGGDPDRFAQNAAESSRRSAEAIADQKEVVAESKEAANELIEKQKELLLDKGVSEDLYDQVNAENPRIPLLTPDEVDKVVDMAEVDVSDAVDIGGGGGEIQEWTEDQFNIPEPWYKAYQEAGMDTTHYNPAQPWRVAYDGVRATNDAFQAQTPVIDHVTSMFDNYENSEEAGMVFRRLVTMGYQDPNLVVTPDLVKDVATEMGIDPSAFTSDFTDSVSEAVGGGGIEIPADTVDEAKELFTDWNPLNADVNQAVSRLASMESISETQQEAAQYALEQAGYTSDAAKEAIRTGVLPQGDVTQAVGLPQGEVAQAVGSHSEDAANALQDVEHVAREAGGEVAGVIGSLEEIAEEAGNGLMDVHDVVIRKTEDVIRVSIQETNGSVWNTAFVTDQVSNWTDGELAAYASRGIAEFKQTIIDGTEGISDLTRNRLFDQFGNVGDWFADRAADFEEIEFPDFSIPDEFEDELRLGIGLMVGGGIVSQLNTSEAKSGGVRPIDSEGNVVTATAPGVRRNDDDDDDNAQPLRRTPQGDSIRERARNRRESIVSGLKNLFNRNDDQSGQQDPGRSQGGGTNQQGGGQGGGQTREQQVNSQINDIVRGETSRAEALEIVNRPDDDPNSWTNEDLSRLANNLGLRVRRGNNNRETRNNLREAIAEEIRIRDELQMIADGRTPTEEAQRLIRRNPEQGGYNQRQLELLVERINQNTPEATIEIPENFDEPMLRKTVATLIPNTNELRRLRDAQQARDLRSAENQRERGQQPQIVNEQGLIPIGNNNLAPHELMEAATDTNGYFLRGNQKLQVPDSVFKAKALEWGLIDDPNTSSMEAKLEIIREMSRIMIVEQREAQERARQ